MKKNIESLLQELEKSEGLEKINIQLKLAHEYCESNNLDKASDYVNEAFEKSNKFDYKYGIAQSHSCRAKIYYSKDLLVDAMHEVFSGLRLFQQLENDLEIAPCLNNIGVLYSVMKIYDKALEYFEKASEFDPNNLTPPLNSAEVHIILKDYEQASQILQELRSKLDLNSNPGHAAKISKLTANIYLEQNRYDEAYKLLNEAMIFFREQDIAGNQIDILNYLGKYYTKIGYPKKAITKYQEAYKLALKYDTNEYKEECCRSMIEFYKTIDDKKNLLIYMELLLELKDKSFFAQQAEKISKLEAKHRFSDMKKQNEELIEKSSRLASIGVMAAGITHEINQPLNAIKVSADSMLFWNDHNPGVLSDLFIQELKQISKGAARIDEIVRHMRSFWITPDYSHSEKLNLNEVILSGLSLIKQQIQSHAIKLDLNLTPKPLIIDANRIHVEQIMINLISNAIHSLDEVDNKNKIIRITTSLDDSSAQVIIYDNGTGIQKNRITKIFDPFYSSRQSKNGMGLGLAIVNRYIDEMRGSIQAENNPDHGVTFVISIPLQKQEK